jgi:hypothetical protein
VTQYGLNRISSPTSLISVHYALLLTTWLSPSTPPIQQSLFIPRPVLIHLVLFSLLEHGSHHRHLLVIYMIVNSLPTHQLHDTSPRGVRRIQLTSIISMDRKNLSSISTGPQKLLISPMLVAFTVLPPTYFIILIAILRSSYYLNSVLACF